MGLLDRATAKKKVNAQTSNASPSAARQSAVRQSAARDAVPQSVQTIIADFHRKNPLFHCIALRANSKDIAALMAGHGTVCIALPGGKCLLLLPGGLDAELFAHRLSQSTGATILFQTSAHEPSLAFNKLRPYLR